MLRFLKGILFCASFVGASAFAGGGPVRTSGAVVFLNEVPIIRFKATLSGMTPDMRANLVAASLEGAKGLVTVRKIGGDAAIYVGEMLCLTVTKADAVQEKSEALKLAGIWASRIRSALELPPLKLSASNLDVPIGAVRELRLVGSRASASSLEIVSPDVATVVRTDEGVRIRAVKAGNGTLRIRALNDEVSLPIVVRPWAANFPQTLVAQVTGAPTMGDTVEGALASTLKTQIKGAEGVRFSYEVPAGRRLETGKSSTYSVKVRATAPDAVDSFGTVQVRVENVPIPRRQDAELWYSNNPEVVKGSMPLFSATLRQDAPARLLYHHVNATSQAMYIRVQVINPSDKPAKVVIIPGDSNPDVNPVRAGMKAADQYFRAWALGSGEVVTIPPESTLPLSIRRLGPGQTTSGLCGLRLMPDSPELLVRTDSWPPFNLAPEWRSAVTSSTPWREVGCPPINDFDRAPYEISEHVYPNPQKSEEVKYEVGGRYGIVRIGQRAIVKDNSGQRLDGNFGVIYSIKASMQNRTQEATDVEVVFEASAGYTGGLFLVNGSLMRTPLLKPKTEQRIAKYRLNPGATRYVDITTLPLSGSSYPATITIRPILDANDRGVHAESSGEGKRKPSK